MANPTESPMLGICFGHQLLAMALGGKVIRNPLGWEVGTCKVRLTHAGKHDRLFSGLPDEFSVMQSHQDMVVDFPNNAECLASSSWPKYSNVIAPAF